MKIGLYVIPLLAIVGISVVACNGGVITEGQEINAPVDIKTDPDTIEKEYPTLADLKPEATPPRNGHHSTCRNRH